MFRTLKHTIYLLPFFMMVQTVMAQTSIFDQDWNDLIYDQADEWFESKEAIQVADNVLLYQRNVGGWSKNIEMHLPISEEEKIKLRKLKSVGIGATIDNDATVQELDFLSKVYSSNEDKRYKEAFIKGINYLLLAQYDNGGWPQFYPLEEGDYSTHITFNDNAMVNVMNVLSDVADQNNRFSIKLDDATISKAKLAFNKGIEVILKTQYLQDGKLTVWCAQHDENTFQPAKARSYELPSLSGSESVGIVLLLMEIENPSREIINAIEAAVVWFDKVKITGIRVEEFKNTEGLKDKKVIKDANAPALWARFYTLENNRPFFCDRDGIKKYSLAEIGYERRNGYGWYDDDPKEIFKKYKKWQLRWAPNKSVIEKK